MKAWVIEEIGPVDRSGRPLKQVEIDLPEPDSHEVLLDISVCGICHTELDEIEGRTAPPKLPVIPGHQAVGKILKKPEDLTSFKIGDRVGVAWIYSSCEQCEFCRRGLQNLCDDFQATGRDRNGGYAEYMLAHKDYIYKIPDAFSDEEAAPLLCAGAIGYRSLRLADIRNGQNLGLTGFGASGHQVLRMCMHQYPDTDIYVFARNENERAFALEIGAKWAGNTTDDPPEKLHAIIDTTPVWKPVTEALKKMEKGGRLVINAIRKEDVDKEELLKLSYHEQLWMEREIKSVANITPADVSEFLELADEMNFRPEYQLYDFDQANEALIELKEGKIRGAKVLRIRQ